MTHGFYWRPEGRDGLGFRTVSAVCSCGKWRRTARHKWGLRFQAVDYLRHRWMQHGGPA